MTTSSHHDRRFARLISWRPRVQRRFARSALGTRWQAGNELTATGRLVIVLVLAAGWSLLGPIRSADATPGAALQPPLTPPLTVIGQYELPAQPWLPGNRGVDLAATTGDDVFAAADGIVVYAGELAGRGVISISHGSIRTTYEPVDPLVHASDVVTQGEIIGKVSAVADGCGPPGGCLHWGARAGESYLDPLSLLRRPRIRLLPIWSTGVPPDEATVSALTSSAVTGSAVTGSAASPTGSAPIAGSTRSAGSNQARAKASTAAGGATALIATGAAAALTAGGVWFSTGWRRSAQRGQR